MSTRARIAVLASVMAAAACVREDERQLVRIDLLALFPTTGNAPATRAIDLADPAQRHLLGYGWSDVRLLADGRSGREITERSATLTFFAGPRPVDVELSIERYLPPDEPRGDSRRRLRILPLEAQVNGMRLRPEGNASADVLRFRIAARTQQPGRNVLELRSFARPKLPPAHPLAARPSLYVRSEFHHLDSLTPSPRVDGDRLILPGGAQTTFYIRTLRASRLEFGVPVGIDPPRVTAIVDGSGSRVVPVRLAGGRTSSDLDLPEGTPVGLRFEAEHDTVVVAPEVVGRGVRPPTARPLDVTRGANVLLYVVDTLRADRLGCYGSTRGTSSNLDRFAAEGIVFERTLSSASWTRPAVASLLTGQHPVVHGAMTVRDRLRDDVPTLAEHLARAGYATAAFVTNVNVAPTFGFARGFDVYRYLPEDPEGPTVHMPAAVLHHHALAWLDGRPAERPFFLYLHATDPHMPYTPPTDVAARFSDLAAVSATERTRLLRSLRDRPELLSDDDVRLLRSLYDAEVAGFDAAFGQLWSALLERGLDRTTLVVFVGDHGEEFREHGGFEHGHTLFQEQIHVPFLVRLPGGGAGGRRVSDLARLVDVMPTVLGVAGIEPEGGLAGTQLLAADGTSTGGTRDEALAWTGVGRLTVEAFVVPPWKIVLPGRASPEVYDLVADPGEQRSMAVDHPALVGYARQRLEALRVFHPPDVGTRLDVDAEVVDRLRRLGYVVE